MGQSLSTFWNQSFFLPEPTLTEKNLPDQHGKVHIITGGYVGCGLELAKILYQKNATVYLAGRSPDKGNTAIEQVKQLFPNSKGKLEFLKLDLADQSTIKKSVEEFTSKEDRLDVLTNNAGVMVPPDGSKDAQGHDLQLGTNCIGHYLFTTLLVPTLKKTAAISPPGTVRVTWAGSLAVVLMSPTNGITFDESGDVKVQNKEKMYGMSKAGNMYLASEAARRFGKDGIISVCWNPGNLKSELQRHTGGFARQLLQAVLLFPAVYGAYTELYAGWSPDITPSSNGCYVIPWGRAPGPLRKDLVAGIKTKEEGGTGMAKKFWEYCEKETTAFV